MNKSRNRHIFLWTALILSNVLWAYFYINQSVFCSYQVGFVKARDQTIKQLYAVMPLVTNRQAKRDEIIQAAQLNVLGAYSGSNEFFQVGTLTFKFDKNENLVEIVKR